MLCQNCHLREATVTLIQTKDGKRETRHLCHSCAEDETFFGQSIFDSFLSSPFADFFEMPQSRTAIADRMQKSRETKKEKKPSNTPLLDQFSRDLTALAKENKLDPLIGRQEELQRMIQILSRRTKNNPVLIGEPGVGKTAVVEGLAIKIATGQVPSVLAGKRVVALDLPAMVAGTRYRGDFEERIKQAIDEVKKSNGQVILFIDEFHTVVGAGGAEGAIDASNILKPALARGELHCIGATTLDEYRKNVEKDPALERRFQPVLVAEPTVEQTNEILAGLKEKYEKHHQVKFADEALAAAASLSCRYISDRFLPDKAIDLIDEAAAKVHLDNKKEVKKEDVEDIVSRWTGIPVSQLKETELQKLLKLEEKIHQKIIGQDEAVSAIAGAVRRGRAGLKQPNRPIGSFIFLGPTGVGKTALTKALAETLFGDENALVRIDMSEYMEKHNVARLVGAPPGYVGYEEGGQLTESIRRRPYSVILLDEIEKAHPDVFNILLQILDEGHLTDSKGKKVDFKNTIIIATSNIGSHIIQEKGPDGAKNELMDLLKSTFRPEFLNRVDEIIIFKSLEKEQIKQIVDIQLKEVDALLSGQKIKLKVSETAKTRIADQGFDIVYGARPLRRLIQKEIENPLSTKILEGEFKKNDTVKVDYQDNKFVFNNAKSKAQISNEIQNPNS